MPYFHYTSGRHLRAIAEHGLTVGDVPTDIGKGRGRVGVWLTTAEEAAGHGLEGSAVDKRRYRLEIDAPEGSPLLVRWSDWSERNATPETVRALRAAASRTAGSGDATETWFVYFGVLAPATIRVCVDVASGLQVTNWGEVSPPELDVAGVPAWRREAWQKRMLKEVARVGRRSAFYQPPP